MSTEFVRAEGLTRRHRTPSTRLFAKPAVTTALDAVDLTLEEGHVLLRRAVEARLAPVGVRHVLRHPLGNKAPHARQLDRAVRK